MEIIPKFLLKKNKETLPVTWKQITFVHQLFLWPADSAPCVAFLRRDWFWPGQRYFFCSSREGQRLEPCGCIWVAVLTPHISARDGSKGLLLLGGAWVWLAGQGGSMACGGFLPLFFTVPGLVSIFACKSPSLYALFELVLLLVLLIFLSHCYVQ